MHGPFLQTPAPGGTVYPVLSMTAGIWLVDAASGTLANSQQPGTGSVATVAGLSANESPQLNIRFADKPADWQT